jgi:hypothetical protein
MLFTFARATCSDLLTVSEYFTVMILGEEKKLLSSSERNFLHTPLLFSFVYQTGRVLAAAMRVQIKSELHWRKLSNLFASDMANSTFSSRSG